MLFFDRWGLTGAGVGVLLSNVFDLAVILVYASVRYRFRLSRRTIATAAVHLPIGAAAYMATLAPALWLRLVLGAACFAAGAALSLRVLCRETSLSEKTVFSKEEARLRRALAGLMITEDLILWHYNPHLFSSY